MSWNGTMNVIVTNQTGGTITDATAAHSWQASNTSVGPQTLGEGQSMSFGINVGSGGSDTWSIGFVLGSTKYYRTGKQCNVEESDLDSGSPIYINFLPPSQGWSIEMPSSSSCTDNFYNTGSATEEKEAKAAVVSEAATAS
jgi:hypothetical protein